MTLNDSVSFRDNPRVFQSAERALPWAYSGSPDLVGGLHLSVTLYLCRYFRPVDAEGMACCADMFSAEAD